MRKTSIAFLIALTIFLVSPFCEAKKVKKNEEVELPSYDYIFEKYNLYPRDLNLRYSEKKHQLNINGVISPDFTRMAYTEVYNYPQTNQTSAALYLINLDTEQTKLSRVINASIKDKDRIPLLMTGMRSSDEDIFRTLTVVDWSEDGSKLLIKERIGEHKRSLWATNLWVYDFETYKPLMLTEVRQAVKYYWKKQGIYLDDYIWDIEVIGWDINNKDRIIVYAYGVNKEDKQKFLGSWSIDSKAQTTKLLSDSSKDYKVSNNGYMLVPNQYNN